MRDLEFAVDCCDNGGVVTIPLSRGVVILSVICLEIADVGDMGGAGNNDGEASADEDGVRKLTRKDAGESLASGNSEMMASSEDWGNIWRMLSVIAASTSKGSLTMVGVAGLGIEASWNGLRRSSAN